MDSQKNESKRLQKYTYKLCKSIILLTPNGSSFCRFEPK